jgi:pimeloyl-ACP methyl ester carboxylesterase
MFLSVVCNEDMARVSPGDAARYTEGTFLGDEWLTRLGEECAEWPVARLPDEYFEPVVGEVPALVLSGALDPVTPPSWGALVAERLTGSRHVIVPGAGHGVSTLGCGPELIAELLDGRNAQALDVECLEKLTRPEIFIGHTGPRP